MDLATLTELLSTIPNSAWGAIGAAALTLFTVWLTNRYNLKHQRQQFDFESLERQRERQVNLRRDVYLPAADAITGMAGALGSMISTDTTDADVNIRAQAFGAALTRVQMVASPETLKLAAELQRSYLTELFALQRLRYPLMLRKSDIEIAKNTRDAYFEESRTCIELMKDYNLAGNRDVQRWQTIERRSAFASEGSTEANRQLGRLTYQQETDRIKLLRDFLNRMTSMGPLQARVLAAVRSELESDAATQLILEESEKTAAEMVRSVNEIVLVAEAGLENVRREIEDDEMAQSGGSPTSP